MITQKEYCLTITFDCNWNCNYCIIDTHSKKITPEMVLNQVELIEPNSKVSISGGEPGTQSKEFIQLIINKLKEKNCYIEVNTNGLFLKRYYSDFYNQVDFILHHFSEDLDLNNKIQSFEDPDNKIQVMLVITDCNLPNLDSFLKEYSYLTFHPQAGSFLNHSPIKLSKIEGIRIWSKYKDMITPESKSYLMNNCNSVNPLLNKI